jgi:hypothetical protein
MASYSDIIKNQTELSGIWMVRASLDCFTIKLILIVKTAKTNKQNLKTGPVL